MPVGNKNYFGFTTQPLCKRRSGHIDNFKKYPNRKVYKAMREAGMSADDIELIWVEDYPCETKEQAKARERYYIENFGTLNNNLPFKEGTKMKEYQREYYANNLAKVRKYYTENRDDKIAYQREYRNDNRDEINVKKREYMRENYANNREKKLAYMREYNARKKLTS